MAPAEEDDGGISEVLVLDEAGDQVLPEVDDFE